MQFLNNNKFIKALSILLAIIVWQAIALFINNNIVLVGPIQVLNTLFTLIQTNSFWFSIFNTSYKILLSLIVAIFCACVLAFCAYKCRGLEILLWPYTSFMKATPLASIIVISLIWLSSAKLSLLTVFIICFPIVYTNILHSLKAIDTKLLQAAKVFKISTLKTIRYIFIPHCMPSFYSSLKLCVGLAFKAGVAAELIGLSKNSIGSFIYESKIYLSTADLFAWTFVVIIISIIFENLLLKFIKIVYRHFINPKEVL